MRLCGRLIGPKEIGPLSRDLVVLLCAKMALV